MDGLKSKEKINDAELLRETRDFDSFIRMMQAKQAGGVLMADGILGHSAAKQINDRQHEAEIRFVIKPKSTKEVKILIRDLFSYSDFNE